MPATISDLKSAFPSDPAFALDAAERGLELVEAKAEYADKLTAQLEAREREMQARLDKLNADLEAKQQEIAEAQERSRAPRGVKPAAEVVVSSAPAMSAAEEVRDRVNALMARGADRHKAHAQVMRQDADLRERYVAEHQNRRLMHN